MIPFTALGPEMPRKAMKSKRLFEAVLRGINVERSREYVMEADLVAKNRKSELQRAIEHIRLGEPEHDAASQISEANLHLQGLALSEEVVGGIV
jgi:hypothetical protein